MDEYRQGFTDALDLVETAINHARQEAEHDGDDEWLDDHECGWSSVENMIEEIRERE